MLINLKALRKTRRKMVIEKGVYLSPKLYQFNFNALLEIYGVEHEQATLWDEVAQEESYGYGVCDSYKQILERYPELITSTDKYIIAFDKYIIALTKVRKGIEAKPFGWRWRKWGDYIGTQNETTEYLYDEPDVEQVYCYKIYKIKA